ncbi:MAG: hypothetical protein Q9191_002318 [Dirinaria sp. TL-2023a]
MRLYVETSARWQATFDANCCISDLKAAVKESTGNSPTLIGLRSICWKAFLLFGNLDKSTWPKTLSDSRSAYSALRDHFLRHIERPDDISAADPLTDDKSSQWSNLRQDEELRAEIFQDVERCMPENSYFREPATQSMLLDILFIFCKLNQDIGYRQGMHEVLAPILWVISRDAIDPQSFANAAQKDARSDHLILACFDPKYLEHDSFTIFGIIMQTVKSFYEAGPNSNATASAPFSGSTIVERSRRIHEEYLHKVDPDLSHHLAAIEILPQIFLIRWIRLLFGREFPLDGVLSLWDVLFAEDPALNLVDLVCVSMLLRIRAQRKYNENMYQHSAQTLTNAVMEADYSGALTLLLRYPAPHPPHGPQSFVEDALYLSSNMSEEGGIHLVSKYAIGNESAIPSASKRGKRRKQHGLRSSLSPNMSPGKYLQEQGGIEGIIQEAARGVYSRGEKWGVAKALRGAYQGLQSAGSTPSKLSSVPRWSLDTGTMVADETAHLTARVAALEQRNKELAKLLEKAMKDLWVQQRESSTENAKPATDALSLAIAKVQFVQVYLENPSMPLPAEEAREAPDKRDYERSERSAADLGSPTRKPRPNYSPMRKVPVKENRKKGQADSRGPSLQTSPKSPGKASTTINAIESIPSIDIAQSATGPSSPPVRPALAQSSFSWMLGQEQHKSDFVAASRFSTEKERARGRAGFLFGDQETEAAGESSPVRKGKNENKEDQDGDEGIDLITIESSDDAALVAKAK